MRKFLQNFFLHRKKSCRRIITKNLTDSFTHFISFFNLAKIANNFFRLAKFIANFALMPTVLNFQLLQFFSGNKNFKKFTAIFFIFDVGRFFFALGNFFVSQNNFIQIFIRKNFFVGNFFNRNFLRNFWRTLKSFSERNIFNNFFSAADNFVDFIDQIF